MAIKVRNAQERSRYELLVDGKVAGVLDYLIDGDLIIVPHTEIDPSRRGEGLGAVLVRGALDDVRTTGRTVVPACWFVRAFVEANGDYADIVAA